MSFSLFYIIFCLVFEKHVHQKQVFKRYFSGCTWVLTDVFKATKNTCSHAYSKRQIQDGKWADKNTSKTILIDKTGVKILFFGRSNWGKEKGNLGHLVQIHVCRQISLMTSLRTQTAYFRKIRERRPRISAKYVCVRRRTLTNIIQKNAFIGVTSFNICKLQKKRKRTNETRRSSSFK